MFIICFLNNFATVTMQALKDAPPDMQCKDKFLLQSVVASPGATPKDITPEMVTSSYLAYFSLFEWSFF